MAINTGIYFSWYAKSKYSITLVKYGFTVIGLCLLAGGILLYNNTQNFVSNSITAQGIVVDLIRVKSSESIHYRPQVKFETSSGELIQFTSNTASNIAGNPAKYHIGDAVDVIYQPGSPHKAKINSFWPLWLGPLILDGLGTIFFTVGFTIILYTRVKPLKTTSLENNGIAVKAKYLSTEYNTAITANGKHPYKITAQWLNPATNELHIFTSDNIWFDPRNHIKTELITVLLEKGDPKNYHMDITFLSTLADK